MKKKARLKKASSRKAGGPEKRAKALKRAVGKAGLKNARIARADGAGKKRLAAKKAALAFRKAQAAERKGFVYDLYGTLVLTDCLVSNHFKLRKGVVDVLKKQKKKGYLLACFADDEKEIVDQVIDKSGLRQFIDEMHYGNELDDDGLKDLNKVSFKIMSFSGDMPRDERSAEKYGVSFVKVHPFTIESDALDFRKVGKAISSGVKGDWLDYAKENKMKRIGDERHVEFIGEGQRVRVEKEKWLARFY